MRLYNPRFDHIVEAVFTDDERVLVAVKQRGSNTVLFFSDIESQEVDPKNAIRYVSVSDVLSLKFSADRNECIFNAETDNIVYPRGGEQKSVKAFANCKLHKLIPASDNSCFYALAYPFEGSFSTYILTSNKKTRGKKTTLPLLFKSEVHEFVDFRAVGKNRVKILVRFENEKLLSFTYANYSGAEKFDQWELIQENPIIEQCYAFRFPFLVSTFGRNKLVINDLDELERVYFTKIPKSNGYITNLVVTQEWLLFVFTKNENQIQVFMIDLLSSFDRNHRTQEQVQIQSLWSLHPSVLKASNSQRFTLQDAFIRYARSELLNEKNYMFALLDRTLICRSDEDKEGGSLEVDEAFQLDEGKVSEFISSREIESVGQRFLFLFKQQNAVLGANSTGVLPVHPPEGLLVGRR